MVSLNQALNLRIHYKMSLLDTILWVVSWKQVIQLSEVGFLVAYDGQLEMDMEFDKSPSYINVPSSRTKSFMDLLHDIQQSKSCKIHCMLLSLYSIHQ